MFSPIVLDSIAKPFPLSYESIHFNARFLIIKVIERLINQVIKLFCLERKTLL